MDHSAIVGGFTFMSDNCMGCGHPLTIDNASMVDGCPCNSPLGVNNHNETRWRLLLELQRRQSVQLERLAAMETVFDWMEQQDDWDFSLWTAVSEPSGKRVWECTAGNVLGAGDSPWKAIKDLARECAT
jgi:hypothetical protein